MCLRLAWGFRGPGFRVCGLRPRPIRTQCPGIDVTVAAVALDSAIWDQTG